MIRDSKTNSEKVKKFLYLWILFCPLIILSLFLASNWGEYILSYFMTYDFEVSNMYLSYIVLISVIISFVGSSQALYQGINKSIFLLGVICISVIVGFICFFNNLDSFVTLVRAFLMSISVLLMMVLAHLIFIFVSKTNKSRN